MTKKNLMLVLAASASVAVAGAVVFGIRNHKRTLDVTATECLHEVVEHYEATEATIEHWACCECHHAWADQGKTIEVSTNTTTDRERLGTDIYYYPDYHLTADGDVWDWGGGEGHGRCKAVYSATQGVVYSTTLTGDTYQLFVSSVNTNMEMPAGNYAIEVSNHTGVEVNAAVVSRQWGNEGTTYRLAPGATSYIFATADLMNSQTQKGPAIRITHTGGKVGLTGYVTVSKPKAVSEIPEKLYQPVPNKADWVSYISNIIDNPGPDPIAPFSYSANVDGYNDFMWEPGKVYEDLPTEKYVRVQITNSTGYDVYVKPLARGWGNLDGYSTQFQLRAGGTTLVYTKTELWNLQTAGGSKGLCYLFWRDGATLTGSLSITAPVVVDEMPTGIYDRVETNDNNVTNFQTLGYDADHGFYHSLDTSRAADSLNYYLRGRVFADINLYQGIKVYIYNSGPLTAANFWSEDWGGNNQHTYVSPISSHAWSECLLTLDTWNGNDTSHDVGIYDTGLARTGELRISFGEFVAA